MKLKPIRDGGFTLIEASVAAAISLMALCGTFAANTNCLDLLRAANRSVSASQSLQERVDQIRTANWVQITDSDFLEKNILQAPTNSARGLPNCVEILSLAAYPPPTSGTTAPIKLTRSNNTVVVNSTDTDLKEESLVKAEWTLTWTGSSGNICNRTTAILICKGGKVK